MKFYRNYVIITIGLWSVIAVSWAYNVFLEDPDEENSS